jgi:hypothetical protein
MDLLALLTPRRGDDFRALLLGLRFELRGVFAALRGDLRALRFGVAAFFAGDFAGVFLAERLVADFAADLEADFAADLAALRSGDRRVSGDRGGGDLAGDFAGDFRADFFGDVFFTDRDGDRFAGDALRADFFAVDFRALLRVDLVGLFFAGVFLAGLFFAGLFLAGLFFGLAAAERLYTTCDFTAPPDYSSLFNAVATCAALTPLLFDVTCLEITSLVALPLFARMAASIRLLMLGFLELIR